MYFGIRSKPRCILNPPVLVKNWHNSMDQPPKFTRAHCNACAGERNHVVLHHVLSDWRDKETNEYGSDTYETLQCAGCDAIKLRHTQVFSGQPDRSVTYFPAATFRRRPEWFVDLLCALPVDDNYTLGLLNEIYVAMQHNLLRVAAMGIRALLESVMINKVGDQGSFKSNIAEFEAQGFVSRIQASRLSSILDAGSATIHRGYSPTREDVVILIDIAEHIVESVFVHSPKISALVGRVPKRS
jgi:Domain of unknown function (DUF4145)